MKIIIALTGVLLVLMSFVASSTHNNSVIGSAVITFDGDSIIEIGSYINAWSSGTSNMSYSITSVCKLIEASSSLGDVTV